jgi:hypothetical protein
LTAYFWQCAAKELNRLRFGSSFRSAKFALGGFPNRRQPKWLWRIKSSQNQFFCVDVFVIATLQIIYIEPTNTFPFWLLALLQSGGFQEGPAHSEEADLEADVLQFLGEPLFLDKGSEEYVFCSQIARRYEKQLHQLIEKSEETILVGPPGFEPGTNGL